MAAVGETAAEAGSPLVGWAEAVGEEMEVSEEECREAAAGAEARPVARARRVEAA